MVSQNHRKKVMQSIIFSKAIHSLIPDLLEKKRSVQRFSYFFTKSLFLVYWDFYKVTLPCILYIPLCNVPAADLPRYLSQKHHY